ncbi:MAG: diguanylate cyclase [Sedimentisphaerales bacterium]|nr:diguanylate cyclase [Sedimentisphaerales bacterium]
MFVPRIRDIKDFDNEKEILLSIQQDATVTEASKIMSENHIGCVVVSDNDNFIGILSERDILSKVVVGPKTPKNTIINEVMTSSVIYCSPDTKLTEAENLMAKHQIRHLPVLEDGKAIGMISTRDLIAYRLKSNKAMQAAAEQLAMLPTGLKSLEFDDVISLAINDVPKNFGAECSTLCLVPQDGSEPLINCNNCGLEHNRLMEAAANNNLPQSIQITNETKCPGCNAAKKHIIKQVVPLKIHDQCNNNPGHVISGFLCMCRSAGPDEKPESSQLYKASLLQQMLEVNLTNAKLYKSYQDARKDSETDPLTGLGTRRVLENVLKAECARASRYHRVFSIAIIDLDHFKTINDTAGHAAGDQALKKLAKLMKKCTRETDAIITRFGGDEFVLVLPEAGISGAKIILERIRRQLNRTTIPAADNPSISCGIAEFINDPADTPETIMERADEALYYAKRNGRNQVVIYEPALAVV